MNQRTEKYLALYDDFELRLNDESFYYQQLDLLWDSFSEEEIVWIEDQLKKRKTPQAPKDLGLVDQVVPIGSSILPRVKSKDNCYPTVTPEYNKVLKELGFHEISATPSINMEEIKSRMFNPSKEEIVVELIDELLFQGIDEGAHYNVSNNYKVELPEFVQNLKEVISDIDSMDLVMSKLREVVISRVKEVIENYEGELK